MMNNNGTKKYLAIFDMDGTLFDTRDLNYCSYRDALLQFGIDLDKEYFTKNCNGLYYKDFLPKIVKSDTNIEEIHNAKKKAYSKNLSKAKSNQNLFNIIKEIRKIYYIALVTTASLKNTNDILEYFNYKNLFDLIISNEDVTKTKPNPEGFFKAINHFNIEKENVIIFEDSSVGIQAARATGASVVVVNKF